MLDICRRKLHYIIWGSGFAFRLVQIFFQVGLCQLIGIIRCPKIGYESLNPITKSIHADNTTVDRRRKSHISLLSGREERKEFQSHISPQQSQ